MRSAWLLVSLTAAGVFGLNLEDVLKDAGLTHVRFFGLLPDCTAFVALNLVELRSAFERAADFDAEHADGCVLQNGHIGVRRHDPTSFELMVCANQRIVFVPLPLEPEAKTGFEFRPLERPHPIVLDANVRELLLDVPPGNVMLWNTAENGVTQVTPNASGLLDWSLIERTTAPFQSSDFLTDLVADPFHNRVYARSYSQPGAIFWSPLPIPGTESAFRRLQLRGFPPGRVAKFAVFGRLLLLQTVNTAHHILSFGEFRDGVFQFRLRVAECSPCHVVMSLGLFGSVNDAWTEFEEKLEVPSLSQDNAAFSTSLGTLLPMSLLLPWAVPVQ